MENLLLQNTKTQARWRNIMKHGTYKTLTTLLTILSITATLAGGTFIQTEAEFINGEKFTFPDDIVKHGPALFGIAMGTTRESGEIQQKQLLDWERMIRQAGGTLAELEFHHFPIIEAPGFVKGLIRRGIAKSYGEYVEANRAAVIFIKDTNQFADQAGIPLDDRTTVALILSDGTIAGYVKGPPEEHTLAQVLTAYLQIRSPK
jgi:hypothetical protein